MVYVSIVSCFVFVSLNTSVKTFEILKRPSTFAAFLICIYILLDIVIVLILFLFRIDFLFLFLK